VTDLVAAAHDYLAAGLEIIALTGKRPNTAFHPHGLTDAMSGIPENEDDDNLIRMVFTHPKTTGVGILIPEHVFVADVDSEEAAKTLMSCTSGLPDTAVAKTRNGLHFWFVSPHTGGSIWVDKLLLRGRGSYVVAPPSEHPDGGTYQWIGTLVDPESGMLTGLDWLPALFEAHLAASLKAAAEKPEHDPVYRTVLRDGKIFRELDPDALGGLKHAIIKAEDGNQNNVIAWAAMTARDEGIPIDTAMAELLAASIEGGHPEARARETIKAAYRRRPRG
jgi:hypothetical protein